MERFLKDYLVEHADGSGRCFLVTCTICGRNWKSTPLRDGAADDGAREAAAREAAAHNHVCQFCGRPVCDGCFEDVEGISLCVQCGDKLRKRLETL